MSCKRTHPRTRNGRLYARHRCGRFHRALDTVAATRWALQSVKLSLKTLSSRQVKHSGDWTELRRDCSGIPSPRIGQVESIQRPRIRSASAWKHADGADASSTCASGRLTGPLDAQEYARKWADDTHVDPPNYPVWGATLSQATGVHAAG